MSWLDRAIRRLWGNRPEIRVVGGPDDAREEWRNGVPCRMLDIQELLSDSGVGRQQHVIVSQGQIDAVLNARPEDRRAFIEEAAGILKHRRRKERALRKLALAGGARMPPFRRLVVEGLAGDLPPGVFLRRTPLTEGGRALSELGAALRAQGGSTLDKLHRLTAAIHSRMTFDTCKTGTDTAASEAFAAGHGVCRAVCRAPVAWMSRSSS